MTYIYISDIIGLLVITVVQCFQAAAGQTLQIETAREASILEHAPSRFPGNVVQIYATACGKVIQVPMGERVLAGDVSQEKIDTLAAEIDSGLQAVPVILKGPKRETSNEPPARRYQGAVLDLADVM